MSSENKMNIELERKKSSTDGEIDLTALFRSIWNTRKLVVVAVLLTVLGLAGLVFLSKIAIPTTTTSQFAVQFVFPGAAKGRYPNESRFVRSDILAPSVLNEVYRVNGLNKYGIKKDVFFNSLSVHPFGSAYSSILAGYKNRLKNPKLSFAERKEIEHEMQGQLRSATGDSAVLRLTLTKRFGISEQLVQKILHDIFRQWAIYSIQQRGVLNLPNLSSSRKLLQPDVLLKYDSITVTEMLFDQVIEQKDRLKEILDLSGAKSILDKKSGLSVQALIYQLEQLEKYDLAKVKIDVIRGIQKKSRNTVLEVLRLRAESFDRVRDEAEKKVSAIANSYSLYSNQRKIDNTTSPGRLSQSAPARTETSAMPQLSGSFIDKLIEIIQQKNDIIYRQKLVDNHGLAKNEAISAGAISQRIRLLIKRLEAGSDSTPTPGELTKKLIISGLGQAIAKLNEYNETSARLYEELSNRRVSRNGQLYVGLELPSDKKTIVDHPILNRNTYIIFFLTAFATAIFAMFGGLISQLLRADSKN